jgi:toxin CptA
MSIAVTVIVRTSAGLRLAHACLCCCVVASGAACPGRVAPLLCALAGLAGWWWGRQPRKACTLDISGVGQLRLTVYQQIGTTLRLLDGSTLWPGLLLLRLGRCDGAGDGAEAGSGDRTGEGAGHRSGDSTSERTGDGVGDGGDGRVRTLVVLADSVSRPELRALSLACRAVAARVEIKTPTL